VKIFCSIASYQDPILPYTIKSILENSKYKNDLVLGVFDQSKDILKDLPDNVRYKTCDPEDAKGACWARSTIQTDLFEGEDIFMQIDSHTLFEKDWDKDLLEKYSNCFNWFEKPIITGYPRGFDVLVSKGGFLNTDEEYIFRITTDDPDQTHALQLHLPWVRGYNPGQMAHVIPGKKYFRGFAMAGGGIFTEGKWVEEVPYDKEIYFNGEEATLALRSFTHGYDMVHVPNLPLYHWYNTEEIELKRKLHWDGNPEEKEKIINESFKKVDRVLQGKVTDKYGIGNKRTLKEYADLSGMDYENKLVHIGKSTFIDYENKELSLDEDFE
tara:strand:- start:1336 stop:2313 length:978 start_codon:yes stop_codon:yes gene_type:complete